jgi:hypothetical protein
MKKEDYIDLVLIHENGETKISVENGPSIKCSDLSSDEVIKKFMTQAVPGFGTPHIDDKGHTSEYYEERQPPSIQQEESLQDETFIQKRRSQPQEQKEIQQGL